MKEKIIATRQMMAAYAPLRYPSESVSRTEDFAIPGAVFPEKASKISASSTNK
jgi:hypothetical protein